MKDNGWNRTDFTAAFRERGTATRNEALRIHIYNDRSIIIFERMKNYSFCLLQHILAYFNPVAKLQKKCDQCPISS